MTSFQLLNIVCSTYGIVCFCIIILCCIEFLQYPFYVWCRHLSNNPYLIKQKSQVLPHFNLTAARLRTGISPFFSVFFLSKITVIPVNQRQCLFATAAEKWVKYRPGLCHFVFIFRLNADSRKDKLNRFSHDIFLYNRCIM